jgi:hypothetical protein
MNTKSDSLEHFLYKSGRVSLLKRRRVQFLRVYEEALFKIRPEYSNSRSKRGETMRKVCQKHEFGGNNLGPP